MSRAEANDTTRDNEMPDEGPPIPGTWPRVYAAVLVYVAALIFLFWLFARAFAE